MARSDKPVEDPAIAVEAVLRRGETLQRMRKLAAGCVGCDLYLRGTQTVWGEGASNAPLVLIGEQPGDQEDREGRPFVGPAGKLLRESLETAAIPLSSVYFTNTVKHFRWVESSGKRRLHKKPAVRHVNACSPWLQGELKLIEPEALVCLGATAAQALFGRDFRVTERRGEKIETPLARYAVATVHPSSLLRVRGRQERAEARQAFIDDLVEVRRYLQQVGALRA